MALKKPLENIVGKGENSGNLFPQCFLSFQDQISNIYSYIHREGRKHCGKRRERWLPAFSPLPTMFSKGFPFKVVKSRDCVVELNIGSFRLI